MRIWRILIQAGGFAGFGAAQFPPTPEGLTVLQSKFHENVTISFKEPGICETTPGVKSYSGYVYLPPGLLDDNNGGKQDYPINTFFWFFEARKDPETAPLAIWLNGGPGASSMMGLLEENGPCFVDMDSKSTYLNPWSWNNEVNMIYLDQPTQVGFSYDTATNCTFSPITTEDGETFYEEVVANFSESIPKVNMTHRIGTFASQEPAHTANTTATAAHALWHFMQTWFFEFPKYKPHENRISLWGESYGGHYGPGFFRFFQEQNKKIENGSSAERGAHYLHLDSLGIVNGLVDMVVQGETMMTFPNNNTYGIKLYNKSTIDHLHHEWHDKGGCKDQLLECRATLRALNPDPLLPLSAIPRANSDGKNLTELCECFDKLIMAYFNRDDARGWFDISHPRADPFPAPTLYGYLTEEPVLAALGVPVNYSEHSAAVAAGFRASHDVIAGGFLDSVGFLLDSGVKVHMMYGDRDFACNWVGGERASLAVNYSRSAEFAEAGYTWMHTTEGLPGGLTRQAGNFSFTRVFQAGHEVPAYQPEAAYAIFQRAMFGKDIPTGKTAVTDSFVTEGPGHAWWVSTKPPVMPRPRCHVLKPDSCSAELWKGVMNGTAVVKDWFVVDEDEETWKSGQDPSDGQQIMVGSDGSEGKEMGEL